MTANGVAIVAYNIPDWIQQGLDSGVYYQAGQIIKDAITNQVVTHLPVTGNDGASLRAQGQVLAQSSVEFLKTKASDIPQSVQKMVTAEPQNPGKTTAILGVATVIVGGAVGLIFYGVNKRKEKNQRFDLAFDNLHNSCLMWMNAAKDQEVTSVIVADFLTHLSEYEAALQALPKRKQAAVRKQRNLAIEAVPSIADHITNELEANGHESPSRDAGETVIDLKPYLLAQEDFLAAHGA